VEFRILGPLEVLNGKRRLPLGGTKQREVLAALLLSANRVVPEERLVHLVWGEDPPPTARNVLQVYVSQLRKLLGADRLTRHGPGYVLHVESGELDLMHFESLLASGRQDLELANLQAAAGELRDALGLWRGPALVDLEGTAFAPGERARLEELRLLALEERIEADLRLGRHAELVGELYGLIEEHPLREGLCARLMLALYRSGRQAEASEVYQRTREALVEEFGMEPGLELQKLLKAILNQDPSLDLEEKAREQSTPSTPVLPADLTSFIGRAKEVAEVAALMDRYRLVTLTGTGGIGKTRLAVEAARNLAGRFDNRVWLVDLAPLTDSGVITQTIAFTLSLRDEVGRPAIERLIEFLRSRRALLILDNCEHLVEETAELSSHLLMSCPSLRILATSREALSTSGECVKRVSGLTLPEPGQLVELEENEAVALFADRARASLNTFELNPVTAPAIVEICWRLDGIPLAIELAAARVRVMSVESILKRLEDRFRLLTGGSRTAVGRQRTLLASVQWSYDLLTKTEQALFRRLSVFAGSLSLEAAESICQANADDQVLDLVTQLVDKSLVLPLEAAGGVERYRLLESLRQFGSERLVAVGEAAMVRDRHASYFLGLAEMAEAGLKTAAWTSWMAKLELEIDNLRSALDWLGREPLEEALRLAGALERFWARAWLADGRTRLTSLLSSCPEPSEARLKALAAACFLALQQADYASAEEFLKECIQQAEHLGNQTALGRALDLLGIAYASQTDWQSARPLFERSIEILRAVGDPWYLANALNDYGFSGHLVEPSPGWRDLVEEGLALARQCGDPWDIALILDSVAVIEFDQGEFSAATEHWVECLELAQAMGERWMTPHFLEGIARVCLAKDAPGSCLRLLGASAAIRGGIGAVPQPIWREVLDKVEKEARTRLNPSQGEDEWQAGLRIPREQAITLARTIALSGQITA
jgi:predicted ATPase/DNA-binding SARP family transcriptional activator